MRNLSLVLTLGCLAWVFSAQGADVALKLVDKQPPPELDEEIRKVLDAKAIQLLKGDKPVYEFWFRRDIPLKSKPESAGKSLESVDELTFLGVATVGEGQRDYKDNEIIPGVYTVRFGLQPQDGDHLGTSEYPFFAVLLPAKSDSAPDAIKRYRAMVRASAKATAAGHPGVLSLRPISGDLRKAPTLTKPVDDHKAVALHLPAKAAGESDESILAFELVYEGRFKH